MTWASTLVRPSGNAREEGTHILQVVQSPIFGPGPWRELLTPPRWPGQTLESATPRRSVYAERRLCCSPLLLRRLYTNVPAGLQTRWLRETKIPRSRSPPRAPHLGSTARHHSSPLRLATCSAMIQPSLPTCRTRRGPSTSNLPSSTVTPVVSHVETTQLPLLASPGPPARRLINGTSHLT